MTPHLHVFKYSFSRSAPQLVWFVVHDQWPTWSCHRFHSVAFTSFGGPTILTSACQVMTVPYALPSPAGVSQFEGQLTMKSSSSRRRSFSLARCFLSLAVCFSRLLIPARENALARTCVKGMVRQKNMPAITTALTT
jgi:hypothetical protein